jgi:hypothetical protein
VKSRFGLGPVFAPGRLWLPLACAVALIAGLVRLGDPGLWIDEIYTARWLALPWDRLFATLRDGFYPPVFFVLEALAVRVAGDSEVGLRLLSLLAGVGAVAATFWAFRPLLNERFAAGTAWFLAISPQFFLYARMARYYALAALVAMIAHGLFVRLAVQRGRPRSWILYALASALMVLTSYLTLCLLVAHGVWAAFARRRRGLGRGWLLATAGTLLLLSPWLLMIGGGARGVLAPGAAARPGEWLPLLGFDFHALTASELLYPWEPLGALGLLCGGWLLLAGGIAAVRRGLGRSVLLPALAALALSWAAVSTIPRETPFVALPPRTLFLWPFAAVVMALGALDSAQHKPLRWAATLGLMLAWAGGWLHLYRQEHYLNPIYLTPGREVARDLRGELGADDAVISDDDSGANYYLAREAGAVKVLEPGDPAAVSALLASHDLRRVWRVRLSRDGSRRSHPSGSTEDALAGWGAVTATRGYLAIDQRYRAVKRSLLGMPGYPDRVVVERWERSP